MLVKWGSTGETERGNKSNNSEETKIERERERNGKRSEKVSWISDDQEARDKKQKHNKFKSNSSLDTIYYERVQYQYQYQYQYQFSTSSY